MESLCIKIGSLCWELTLDLIVVNYDGNISDCMCYASLAALSLFRLPNYSKNSIDVQNPGKKIFLSHFPFLMSFGVYNSKNLRSDEEAGLVRGEDFLAFDPTVYLTRPKKNWSVLEFFL